MDLLSKAREARLKAYAPYSNYLVGCALLTEDGKVYLGANVENASYPLGSCAERSAVSAMIIGGGSKTIKEVAVIGSGDIICTPCGGCRQILREFSKPATIIRCYSEDGKEAVYKMSEILPDSFGPDHLDQDRIPEPVEDTEAPRSNAAQLNADKISALAPDFRPDLAVILGSGLNEVFADAEIMCSISYSDLNHFPEPAVKGHHGRLSLAKIHKRSVMIFSGRAHYYEGDIAEGLKTLIRTIYEMGCSKLIITNACGSMRPEFTPGSLILIKDHINMLGQNPLTGPNDELYGPRFIDMAGLYSEKLRLILKNAAKQHDISLREGVYAAWLGPSFETPAEIRMLERMGADLVGMSTVPEAILAHHCGIEVAAISAVTNIAAGISDEQLSHEHTLKQAQKALPALASIFKSAFLDMASK